MNEKSFLLLKPDAMNDSKIVQSIKEELRCCDLKICFETNIRLDQCTVISLWRHILTDDIIKQLFINKFCNVEMSFMEVFGSRAIEKVHHIKKKTRAKYAKNSIDNCFHAPRNILEYNHDIELLQDVCSRSYLEIESNNGSNYCSENEIITQINSFLEKNNFLYYFDSNCSYHLFLCDDDVNLIENVAKNLHRLLPNIPLAKCYAICIMVGGHDRICIRSSNKYNYLKRLKENFENCGINVQIERKKD